MKQNQLGMLRSTAGNVDANIINDSSLQNLPAHFHGEAEQTESQVVTTLHC